MQPKQKQIYKNNFIKPKRLSLVKISVISAVILVVAATVFVLSKKEKPNIQAAVSTAYASSIPDWWNLQYFGHSICESELCKPNIDIDNDGLTNYQEYYYHTDPLDPHTVKDSLTDGELVAQGFDPSRPGHIKFNDLTTDVAALSDGLVFDSDIKKLVQQTQDLSKVTVAVPIDSELKISTDNSPSAYNKYFSDLNALTNKYFPQSNLPTLERNLKAGDDQSDDIKNRSSQMSEDLKRISVPQRFVSYHKDLIAYYQLLGAVTIGSDAAVPQSPQWYDQAQQFFVVQQRLESEQAEINQEFLK